MRVRIRRTGRDPPSIVNLRHQQSKCKDTEVLEHRVARKVRLDKTCERKSRNYEKAQQIETNPAAFVREIGVKTCMPGNEVETSEILHLGLLDLVKYA